MSKVKKAHQILQEIQSDWENGEEYEAFNIALESMERDIFRKPKAIINEKDRKIGAATFEKGLTIYKCEICNTFISMHYRYCPECGQKLGWKQC